MTLALIAGQGRLPALVAETGDALVVGVEGLENGYPAPDRSFRIEQLGALIADLKETGITEVCFAGAIRRVPLDATKIDPRTKPYVPRMMAALASGDDAALRIVVAIFEEAGFAVRGAHEVRPDLLPEAGDYGLSGSEGFRADAARGWDAIAALGAADIGQACVVSKGQVLVTEASYGTDWMLESLANRPDGSGGLLCKAPKPGQELRIDMPTVGPETVAKAAKAGLAGIAIAAGGVIVIDRAETFAAAKAHGLAFWVRP